MKKVLFSLLAVMFIMASCGGPSAVEFNDAIVTEQKKLYEAGIEFGKKLSDAMTSQSYSNMGAVCDSIVAKIDEGTAVVKDLKTPSGGEKFKEATLDSFQSEKKQFLSIKDKLSKLNSESTTDDVNAFIQSFNEILVESNAKTEAFMTAQKEFAKEKGITLVNK